MKKIIIISSLAFAYLFSFGQSNTYFHNRIDTTIFAVADTVGHGANHYFATNTSADFNIKQYVNGDAVNIFFKKGVTGSATLVLITKTGTLSAKTIKKSNGQNLVSGDIRDSTAILLTYFGSFWRCNPTGNTSTTPTVTITGAGTTTVTSSGVGTTTPSYTVNSSGGGGSQTLAQTLGFGNTTTGHDIIMTGADVIKSSLGGGELSFANTTHSVWLTTDNHVFAESFFAGAAGAFTIVGYHYVPIVGGLGAYSQYNAIGTASMVATSDLTLSSGGEASLRGVNDSYLSFNGNATRMGFVGGLGEIQSINELHIADEANGSSQIFFGISTKTLTISNAVIKIPNAGTPASGSVFTSDAFGNGTWQPDVMLTTTITLTAAQIKTLNSVPVTIVSAPGAGKIIQFIASASNYTFNTTPFTIGNVYFMVQTGSYPCANTNIDPSNPTNQFILGSTVTNNMVELVANQPLQITSLFPDSAVGDGTLTIYLTYRIITL